MIVILYGLVCGITLGLTGGGGSILAVPMLIYWVGLPFHQAVAISMLVTGLTALFGLLLKIRSSEVKYVAGLIMVVSGVIFAPIGSYVSTYVNPKTLGVVFSFLLLLVGSLTWLKLKRSGEIEPASSKKICKKSFIVLMLAGVITGFLTGMFGVGGGFLIVPALIFAIKMPIKNAIATSLLVIFLVSASGFISHLQHTPMHWGIAGYFVLGGSAGMLFATLIKDKINSKMLQKIFSILLVVLGLVMLYVHIR